MDKAADNSGECGIFFVEGGWQNINVLSGDLDGCSAAEWCFAGEQLVAGDTEAVDIGAGIEFAAADLFGAHVERGCPW